MSQSPSLRLLGTSFLASKSPCGRRGQSPERLRDESFDTVANPQKPLECGGRRRGV